MNAFKPGDPVLVVGCLSRFRTCVGLFGFVDSIFPKEGEIFACLLTRPDLKDRHDRWAERQGRPDYTHETGTPGDFIPLTGKGRIARVEALKAHVAAKDKTPSPAFKAIMDDAERPEKRARWAAEEASVAARSAEMGELYKLPGKLKRGDKSEFPAYRDPAVQAIDAVVMGYAARGPKGLTLDDRVRWKQALHARDGASFWSGRPEVRALVQELDLDPMTDGHEYALWKDAGSVYTPTAQLRRTAITLWNKGAAILRIQEATDPDTCWRGKDGEAPGFHIQFAYRRRLPLPPL